MNEKMSHFTLFATVSIIICIPMSKSKLIAIEIPNLAGYKSNVSIAYQFQKDNYYFYYCSNTGSNKYF